MPQAAILLLQADHNALRGVLRLFPQNINTIQTTDAVYSGDAPQFPASTPFVDRNGPMLCTQQISIYTIWAFSEPGDAPVCGAVLTPAGAAAMLRPCCGPLPPADGRAMTDQAARLAALGTDAAAGQRFQEMSAVFSPVRKRHFQQCEAARREVKRPQARPGLP